MSKMIPAYWHDSTPRSEQRVFNILKNDPLTAEWIVFHSLNLKQSGRKPYGEVDFVVVIPGEGVLCLEIKGGRVACDEDGAWTTTDATGASYPLKRSPFAQAREGMFEVRAFLENALSRAPEFSAVPFGHSVVFTDVEAPPPEIGIQPWEVIDSHGLDTGLPALLLRAAKQQRVRLRLSSARHEPQPATVRRIKEALRPNFERIVARSTLVHNSERQLIALTEEQYERLDDLESNPRCLFEGAAGTGKTLLALEFARRYAGAGDRVLLLCFNRLLGEWFSKEVAASNVKGITAGRFYKCLREVITGSVIAPEFLKAEQDAVESDLFDRIYPLFGGLALDTSEPYDVIVMDEAQDLVREDVLLLLSQWVRGGLKDGRWAFFGDFHRQAIFGNRSAQDLQRALSAGCGFFTRANLRQNCRNTRRIGEETALLSGFEAPPYRMGQVDGASVDYLEYSDSASQLDSLRTVLHRILSDPGLDPADVIILSKFRFEHSAAGLLAPTDSFTILPVDGRDAVRSRKPTFRFATAQAFKGMESKAIILCDIDRIETDEDRSLLYVAMSRARSLLTVLLHTRTKDALRDAFGKRLSELWR
jgi:Nuclease-related domain/UvrD-like helicase C-terminal domain/Uncharacterized conserved protein (DUF2075)